MSTRLVKSPLYGICFGIVCLVTVLTLPDSTHYPDAANALQPPNSQHWLGTDFLGRDVWLRVLSGGRNTLVITAVATLLASIPAIFIGLISGFCGKGIDAVFTTLLNAFLALPGLILALCVVTVLGQGIFQIAVAAAITQFAPFAQFVRGLTRQLKTADYVDGAYVIGANPPYILLRVILPNALPMITAYALLTFSYCLLNIGALGFLGLIGDPATPEWGKMLAEGREFFREAPWIIIAPGTAITGLTLMLNFLATQLTRHE